jgi:hypothetical protein
VDSFYPSPNSHKDLLRDSLRLVLYSALLLQTLFAGNNFRVYEGGTSVQAFTLTWSELQGWAFGPEGKWTGKPQEVRLEPTGAGPSRLYLRSDSRWWPLLHGKNPKQPVKAWVECTPDLEAILRQHAPELVVTEDHSPVLSKQL